MSAVDAAAAERHCSMCEKRYPQTDLDLALRCPDCREEATKRRNTCPGCGLHALVAWEVEKGCPRCGYNDPVEASERGKCDCGAQLPKEPSKTHSAYLCDACGLAEEREDLARRFPAPTYTMPIFDSPAPVEIDLAAEGKVIATVLEALGSLPEHSINRVVAAINNLAGLPPDAVIAGRRFHPENPSLVNLKKLALFGEGDEDAP